MGNVANSPSSKKIDRLSITCITFAHWPVTFLHNINPIKFIVACFISSHSHATKILREFVYNVC